MDISLFTNVKLKFMRNIFFYLTNKNKVKYDEIYDMHIP